MKLHAATGDAHWLQRARALSDRMLADFEDRAKGGFFFTAHDHETLLARAKDPFDNALPSGNSVAVLNLLWLERLTGETSYRQHAERALDAFGASLFHVPVAMPVTLLALEQFLGGAGSRSRPNAPAGAEPDSSDIITAKARLAAESAAATTTAPGVTIDAVVTVTVKQGWHIYANPTGVPLLKPTTLEFDPASERSASIVHVTYPAGKPTVLAPLGGEKVSLYEGSIEIPAKIRLAGDAKPGAVKLVLRLNYQACDDRRCEAPASLKVNLPVTIGETAPGAPVRP